MRNGKSVKEYILDSVAIANQAVAADKEKNFDKARALYIEAAQRLENAKNNVPEEHAKILMKYASACFPLSFYLVFKILKIQKIQKKKKKKNRQRFTWNALRPSKRKNRN